jgi:hypothetical protein
MYYIYALIDPRSYQPFYIGKGKYGNNRHLDHLTETLDQTDNRRKWYKINHLLSHNYEITVKFIEENIRDENLAYSIETTYIQKYGRKGIDPDGILDNICMDRRPPSQSGRKQSAAHVKKRIESYQHTCRTKGRKPHSAETRKKLSRPGKSNPFFGKHHKPETRQLHSMRMKGNTNGAKVFEFISPIGDSYIVEGKFAEFCRQHNLPLSTMEKIVKTQTPTISGRAKGWKVIKKTNRKKQ